MSDERTVLKGQTRELSGKGPARRLRQAGLIPAVIYGKGTAPVTLAVDPGALRKAMATPHKFNTVLNIQLEGGGEKVVLLKDYQQHPVNRRVLHADFQEVALDQDIVVNVPVELYGRAAGVVDGGLLSQVTRVISITCLPRAIPESVRVDVTPMKIGQTLHESDLVLPEGIRLAGRKNETIAIISAPEGEAAAPAAEAAGKGGKAGGKK